MSLQFIIGSSGSGKTYHLYKELIRMSMEQDKCNYIALVPEQATLQTQKDIVSMHPAKGVLNIDILSFERLAYRVFEELGCTPKLVLDDVGKNMLLRKAFGKVGGELSVYKKNLKKAGFIDEVKSLFSELYQYRIGEADIEKMVNATVDRPLINRKLQDILTLNRAFNACTGEDMIAAEEVLEILGRVIDKSEIIKNSVITLDGFTGFTPVQYEVIRRLLRLAKKVTVTVTVDERENPYTVDGNHTLFYLSRKTIERLSAIAAEESVPIDKDVRLSGTPYRFKDSEALAFLERELFRYPFNVAQTHEGISVHSLANPQAEARFLSEEIFRLVRNGARYRDIGVIAADVAVYKPFIGQFFDQAGIPYFLDDKKSLISNPLVEYIRAVLEIIMQNFAYESVFRYMKCGFLAEHDEAIFEMENYVLATGIKGRKAWSREWEPLYAGGEHLNMEWINYEKTVIMTPVFALEDALSNDMTVDTAVRALYTWLESQCADITLSGMADEFEEKGEYALAREYRQAYSLVLDLFDRLIGLVPEEHISIHEFSEILDAGFEKIKVGMIPPCVDRVMVGDLTRSRLKDIKHLFIIGVNDCFIPKSNDSGGILSDYDREILAGLGVELAPGARENGFIERLYVYLALTKPSESLAITFSKSNMDGKGLRPSSYLNSVLKLFAGLGITDEDENNESARKIVSKDSALELLIEGLREYSEGRESNTWKELYSWFMRDEEGAKELEFLVKNAFVHYGPESIGRSLARLLYGSSITGSVTRLEQYAACAYAQFLSYGLELSERKQYEFAAADMGNIFHGSIEEYFKYIRENHIEMSGINDGDRTSIVSACVEKACELNGSGILRSSARNQYMLKRIERIVNKTVWALGEQIKRGSFEPTGFEVPFGGGNDAMLITLNEEDTMRLRGKVDRIDTCEDGDDVLIKITDYKSGSTSFDAGSVYNGLQIQLIVYLDAVMQREKLMNPDKNVRVAGMFYYNISDPIIDSDTGRLDAEFAREETLGKLKPNGLVNSDMEVIRLLDNDIDGSSRVIPVTLKDGVVNEKKSDVASDIQFDRLIKHVRAKMAEFAEEIISGNITAAPYRLDGRSGCDYCRFKTVCGFDTKIPGYGFKKMVSMDKEGLWEKLSEEAGGDGSDRQQETGR